MWSLLPLPKAWSTSPSHRVKVSASDSGTGPGDRRVLYMLPISGGSSAVAFLLSVVIVVRQKFSHKLDQVSV